MAGGGGRDEGGSGLGLGLGLGLVLGCEAGLPRYGSHQVTPGSRIAAPMHNLP